MQAYRRNWFGDDLIDRFYKFKGESKKPDNQRKHKCKQKTSSYYSPGLIESNFHIFLTKTFKSSNHASNLELSKEYWEEKKNGSQYSYCEEN